MWKYGMPVGRALDAGGGFKGGLRTRRWWYEEEFGGGECGWLSGEFNHVTAHFACPH